MPDSALYYYNKSLETNSELPNRLDVEKCIAQILYDKGEKDSAYVMIKKKLDEIMNQEIRESYMITLGNMYYEDNVYDSAIYYLEMCENSRNYYVRIASSIKLSAIYNSEQNVEKKAYHDNVIAELSVRKANESVMDNNIHAVYNHCSSIIHRQEIGVASSLYYKSGYGDFYSAHPAVAIMSSSGEELARNTFFREGYTSMSYAPYLFENNGDLYALSTYSPEHDYTCPNYFLNYDNPPTDAKLVLSKLDNELNLLECYEHSFPIDTFENRGDMQWEFLPNEYSGNIFLFSAFEEEGNIVGAYFKIVSADYDNPRGYDSLFFFKMNFNGEFINKKGYERDTYGGWAQSAFRRNQIVKTDSHYILYEKYNDNINGRILYYDKEFNYLTTKYMKHTGYNDQIFAPQCLMDITVVKANDSVTYLKTTATCVENPYDYKYNDCRLYKFNDKIEETSQYLSANNYIIRGTSYTYDRPPLLKAIDVAPNNSLYFACNYDIEGESYSIIECLNNNLDTISTYYYNRIIKAIESTEDGGLLVVSSNSVTKFPATAFGFEPDNIEEAHAHNLHLAVAYPNPGGEVMNIRTGLRNATLSVYDIQGRKVHEQEITDEITSIDASKWDSGTYVWELRAGSGNGIFENGKWVK